MRGDFEGTTFARGGEGEKKGYEKKGRGKTGVGETNAGQTKKKKK